jgi:hypothetical protein
MSIENFCKTYFGEEIAKTSHRMKYTKTVLCNGANRLLAPPLINRRDAMEALLGHAEDAFCGRLSLPPVGVVYGRLGVGKSEIFHRLVDAPEEFYGLYAQADPGLFATSCLHPASCLYAAISFSGGTCVDNCERELYRGDDAFRTAFALRLAYEYLAPINSYRKFVDSVHEYASSRPNDWVETFADGL